ncbi:MAG: glutaredoxin 3 [Polyangiaceae bacterium]
MNEAMPADVKVYSTDYCPYCTRAKALLTKKGVAFEEIDVSNSPEQRKYLIEATGQRTVPQIFINQKPVGGCDDLYKLDREGKLDQLLAG